MNDTKSRKINMILNSSSALFAQVVTAGLGFFTRKFFLERLGAELLGVNSLFSDVLMLFSFADLGLGAAIIFSLYKPIADHDVPKIQILLNFYKKIYNFVILVLVVISILFFPFLNKLKTDIPLNDIRLYFIIFQINNIVGYFWAYRESYVIANQQARKLTIFNTAFTAITSICNIVVVLALNNFLVYLICGVAVNLAKKILINVYIIHNFPETKFNTVSELEKEQKVNIFKKSFAVLVHRIGNLCINQTDSLIVSYSIGVIQWGYVSNYLIFRNTINSIMSNIYSSLLPGVGNVVAKESSEKQLEIFHLYSLVNFWIYAFCFIALYVLSTPFIILFFSKDVILSNSFVFTFFLAFFIDGLRSPVSVLREATGQFEIDKWYTILAAVVNLGSSIIFAKIYGLIGVYIGTILSMIVLHISRTVLLFKNDKFGYEAHKYFLLMLKYIIQTLIALVFTNYISSVIKKIMGLNFISFIVMVIVVMIVPNLIFFLFWCKSSVFHTLLSYFGKRKEV